MVLIAIALIPVLVLRSAGLRRAELDYRSLYDEIKRVRDMPTKDEVPGPDGATPPISAPPDRRLDGSDPLKKAVLDWRPKTSSAGGLNTVPYYLAKCAATYGMGSRIAAPITEFRSVCACEADGLANSRWALHLGMALIPIFGFLGTVHGIMDAMSNIDGIVRAASPNERVAAVSDIGTRPGLAFATTAIALGFGALFKIWSDRLIARERYLVDGCEQLLAPVVYPAIR